MFDFLRKKISGFINSLTKKEEEKPLLEEKVAAKPETETAEALLEEEEATVPKEEPKESAPAALQTKLEKKEAQRPQTTKPEIWAPEAVNQKSPEPAKEEKPKERLKLGIVSSVKSLITQEVEISRNELDNMIENLELELLEADVDINVAEDIKRELVERLAGSKIAKGELHSFVSNSIKETLLNAMANENAFDIVERVRALEKPVKIVFLGINGSGKTTTIAKVAKLLIDNNLKVVLAAADTFRAAAIEQMGVHAEKLGVKMIKRDYGNDPTSVAFDAVNYARAHGIDAVLIDTAGRQDTNINLINEIKKMDRVIKPDIKIYVGESIAGNAIIEQISAFNKEIGVDAVILTKLDCDPKGGTMLSISRATGVPIIYVGVGQRYEDLERFDPKKIVERIVG